MPCIVYQDEERAVLVPKGTTILQASIENKLPHYSECAGKGTCATCKVKVLSGHENLMTRNQQELEIASSRNWDKTIRLACQTRILGDVVLEKIVKNEEDCFNTYLESYYFGSIFTKNLSYLGLKILNFEDLLVQNPEQSGKEKLEKILLSIRKIGILNGGYIAEFQPRFVLIVFGLHGDSYANEQNAVRSAILIKENLKKIQESYPEDKSIQNLEYGIGIHSSNLKIIPIEKYCSILFEGKGLQEIYFFRKLFKRFPKNILISAEVFNSLSIPKTECKKFKALSKTSQAKIFFLVKEVSCMDELYWIFWSHLEIEKKRNEFMNEFFQILFKNKPSLEEKFTTEREKLKLQLFHFFKQIIFGLTRLANLEDMLKDLGKRLKLLGFYESEILDLKEALYQTLKKFFSSHWKETIDSSWKNLLEKVWKFLLAGAYEDI